MRVRLLAPHVMPERLWPAGSILDVQTVTPLMEGLDDEARAAIRVEKIRVYGRWIGSWPNMRLLDDPPIVRSLDNARPVPPFGSGGPR